jgi:branched-chain amino acid aminotransferase
MSNLLPLVKYDGYIWFNGELIKWQDAQVHVLTHALHYGGAVFEGEKAIDGVVFKLHQHTARLLNSAKQMGLCVEYTLEQIIDATYATLQANNLQNAYVRPLIWRSSDSLHISPETQRANFMVACWKPIGRMKKEFIDLNISTWIKPPPNVIPYQCKSAIHYGLLTAISVEAASQSFDDSILLDWRGYIAECTSCNIFFIKYDNDHATLYTPIADCFLNGITRQTVLEIVSSEGVMNIIETHLTPEDILHMDEAFITGTAHGIKKVGSITIQNGLIKTFANDKNIAQHIQLLYTQYVAQHVANYIKAN